MMEGSTAKSECTLNKQGNRYLSTYYFVDTQHPKYLILLGLMVDVVCQERKRRTIHFSDAICCFVAMDSLLREHHCYIHYEYILICGF